MAIVHVEDSLRKKRRDIKEALGNDIIRYIIELVLNSDDSYKRMEKNGTKGIKLIYIELKRNFNPNNECFMITVTDNAEGMCHSDLNNIFRKYGDNNAGGINFGVRGIFGQGASDVLRSCASDKKKAIIETIKDGEYTKLQYFMDEQLRPTFNIEDPVPISNSSTLRKELNIPNNGTCVTFEVPSTIKFVKKTYENLADLMNKCVYFRYLLSKTNRKVIYRYNNNDVVLSSTKFKFDKENQILNEKFNFVFDNKKIICNLKLYKNKTIKDDETKIIVIDQNFNVYDNTMFDFRNNANVGNISGELTINNLYEICYEHLNNPQNPDAILRDNRTGFDTKNHFYDILNKTITPIIQKTLEEHGQKTQMIELTNNRKINNILKIINKIISEQLPDEIDGGNLKGHKPPSEGIKFARNNINITKGKQYDLKLYINPKLVTNNDEINIYHDVTDYVNVSPLKVKYVDKDIKNGIVVKNITIHAIEITFKPIVITACVNKKKCSVIVTVSKEEIHYPNNGLEFYLSDVSLVYNSKHKTQLYFDTNVIPLDSEIYINCETLTLQATKIKIENKMIITTDGIGRVIVESYGGEIGEEHCITAKYNNISTSVKIKLIAETKYSYQGGGMFSSVKLQPNEKSPLQAYISKYDHTLYINSKNPINISILGNFNGINPDAPTFNKHQMPYICDIIASQIA